MILGAGAYVSAMRDLVDRAVASEVERVEGAADLIAAALRRGGVIHAFGAGHSQAIAMEIAGRAGGLVPSNRVSLGDLVLFGGEPPEVLFERKLERDPAVARRLYALTPTRPEDVFVLASNSGATP